MAQPSHCSPLQTGEDWVRRYTDPTQNRRRKEKMRAKLERLGIERADRNALVYDLCCGMGEALETLYEIGFRNLHGVDVTDYPSSTRGDRFGFTRSDVRSLDISSDSVDWLLNIHALHHLETSRNVSLFRQDSRSL